MKWIKSFLVYLGSLGGDRVVHLLNAAVSYVTVGRWASAHGFELASPVSSREELFDDLGRRIAEDRVLYLEFGVASGDSMRHWSGLLKSADARLHGFDTFEGLPEDWNRYTPRGAYSTGGSVPEIADRRVKLFKGLFQDTLPSYSAPDHDVLVINVDCDLYSSASFVLENLGARITPGAYIYFDEFCDRDNELRAFDEFLEATDKQFELIGGTADFRHVAFECVA